MIPFILKKTLLHDKFQYYLENAQKTNQYTNYGWAAKELEIRARDMLKIEESKAVIACCSGTAALHAMLWGMQRKKSNLRVGTQDFTFASNSLGPAEGPIVFDMKANGTTNLGDDPNAHYVEILILTNCFGHLQDYDYISSFNYPYLIFDNAATPYTFLNGSNSCNYGVGSYISLHHTKPLGFGEGGLAIIDKEFEEEVRVATNFGLVDGKFNERSGNYKISEVNAAAILQWWDQFNIDELMRKYQDNYYLLKYEMRDFPGFTWNNFTDDDTFFPNCFPFVHAKHTKVEDIDGAYEVKKYYYPLREFPVAREFYDKIICYAITKGISI